MILNYILLESEVNLPKIIIHLDAEANYTIHTFPQESAKCGDKIKAYISCFHLQLNPSFPFFRDI